MTPSPPKSPGSPGPSVPAVAANQNVVNIPLPQPEEDHVILSAPLADDQLGVEIVKESAKIDTSKSVSPPLEEQIFLNLPPPPPPEVKPAVPGRGQILNSPTPKFTSWS